MFMLRYIACFVFVTLYNLLGWRRTPQPFGPISFISKLSGRHFERLVLSLGLVYLSWANSFVLFCPGVFNTGNWVWLSPPIYYWGLVLLWIRPLLLLRIYPYNTFWGFVLWLLVDSSTLAFGVVVNLLFIYYFGIYRGVFCADFMSDRLSLPIFEFCPWLVRSKTTNFINIF